MIKIKDIGAVRSDKGYLNKASVSDFCAFAADADFLCGHNVVHHDMKYLAPVDGRVPKKEAIVAKCDCHLENYIFMGLIVRDLAVNAFDRGVKM